jgi:hypothetical protein
MFNCRDVRPTELCFGLRLLAVSSNLSFDVALPTTPVKCLFEQSTHDRAAAIVVAN